MKIIKLTAQVFKSKRKKEALSSHRFLSLPSVNLGRRVLENRRGPMEHNDGHFSLLQLHVLVRQFIPLDDAPRNIREVAVLAVLDPSAPVLESFHVGDQLGAGDVVLDVVVEELVAVLVAETTGPEPAAPLVAADLENPVGVAGLVTRTGDLLRVEVARALHYAHIVADEGPRYPRSDQLLGCVALG